MGIKNRILSNKEVFNRKNRQTIEKLSSLSFQHYNDFKNHPKFIPYLDKMSTIKYYSKANIGSRPSKRGNKDEEFDFDKLRAIPFVGGWNQLKQNVPGFYGLGSPCSIVAFKCTIQHVVDQLSRCLVPVKAIMD